MREWGRERGKEGVATRGRDVVSVGVLLKKGCCYKGVLLREMPLRDERFVICASIIICYYGYQLV